MSNQEVVVQFEMDGHTPEEDRKPDNPDGQETHLGCQGRGVSGSGLLCRTSLLAFPYGQKTHLASEEGKFTRPKPHAASSSWYFSRPPSRSLQRTISLSPLALWSRNSSWLPSNPKRLVEPASLAFSDRQSVV